MLDKDHKHRLFIGTHKPKTINRPGGVLLTRKATLTDKLVIFFSKYSLLPKIDRTLEEKVLFGELQF